MDTIFLAKHKLEDYVKKPNRTLIGSNKKIQEAKDKWEKLNDIPTYRYEFNGAYLNGKIYILGGLYKPSVYHVLKTFEAYDIKTKTWEKVADYPKIIHHPGVITVGNYIYGIGGNGLRITPYNYVYRYDPKINKWEQKNSMPTHRGAFGVAELDGKIYAIGGGKNKVAQDTNEVYDTENDTWEKLAPMPTPREHHVVVAANGKIYAMGGYTKSLAECLNINEAYDPKTNTWKTVTPLPLNISGFSACSIGDSIFIFGGEQGWAVSGEVHEYKTKEDKWYRRKELPTPRYASTAVKVDKTIHVIGGNPVLKGNKFSLAHEVYYPEI